MTTKSFRVFEHFDLPLHWINFGYKVGYKFSYFFIVSNHCQWRKEGTIETIEETNGQSVSPACLLDQEILFFISIHAKFCLKFNGKLLYSLMSFSCSHKQNGRCAIYHIFDRSLKFFIWRFLNRLENSYSGFQRLLS